jgi:hypothetical protein
MGRGLLITCIMVPDYWKTICKLSYLRSWKKDWGSELPLSGWTGEIYV